MQVNYAWEWPKTDEDYAYLLENRITGVSEIHIREIGFRLVGVTLVLKGTSKKITWGDPSTAGGSRVYLYDNKIKKVTLSDTIF